MNTRFTLAKASITITEFIKNDHLLTYDERQFLLDLQRRIGAIHAVESGWLKDGVISRARDFHLEVTQESLFIEAQDTIKKMMAFTWISVSQLMQDIKNAKDEFHRLEVANLLEFIEKCFNAVIDRLKHKINNIQPNHAMYHDQARSVEIKNIYDINNYKIVISMGGQILPFYQGSDPLRGDSDGSCLGYVKAWGKEIAKNGYYDKLLVLTDDVEAQQVPNINLGIPVWCVDYYAKTDFRILIADMLKHIRPDKTYVIYMFPDRMSGDSGHAIGIRYLPSQKSHEIFDPNLGIMVFKDKTKFIAYAAHIFSNFYFDQLVNHKRVTSDLRLHVLNTQPSFAIPSIPDVKNETIQPLFGTELSEYIKRLSFNLADVANEKKTAIKDTRFLERHFLKINIFTTLGLSLGLLGVKLYAFLNKFTVFSKFPILSPWTVTLFSYAGGTIGMFLGVKSKTAQVLYEFQTEMVIKYIFMPVLGFFLKPRVNKTESKTLVTSSYESTTVKLLNKIGGDGDNINHVEQVHDQVVESVKDEIELFVAKVAVDHASNNNSIMRNSAVF